MDRRDVLKGMAAISAAPSLRQGNGRRGNVLLLIADDQGLDLGCYGVAVRTPRLDRLAREGTRFTHAYAAVSWCSPSRAVINTGLFTHQNGMYGLQHDVHHQSPLPGIETLPSLYLHRPAEEPYDLTRDPDEVVNLAADPAHHELKAGLAGRLRTLRAATRDPWLPGQTDAHAQQEAHE